MTPLFDGYLRQWRIYKTAMIVFLAINVFSLALALVLSVRYFGFKRSAAVEQKTLLHKIELIDDVFDSFAEIEKNSFLIGKSKSVRTTQEEESVLKLLKNWDALKTLSAEIETPLPSTQHPLLLDDKTKASLVESRAGLTTLRHQFFGELNSRLESYHQNQIELILTGLLTLLFGIVLPQFVLYLIARTMNRVRVEMQNTVRDILKSFNETSAAFGPKPFQNVEFWLQILLLSGEQASRLSRHPVAHIAGEMAFLVRQELKQSGHRAA